MNIKCLNKAKEIITKILNKIRILIDNSYVWLFLYVYLILKKGKCEFDTLNS